jgi:hypothetical protein
MERLKWLESLDMRILEIDCRKVYICEPEDWLQPTKNDNLIQYSQLISSKTEPNDTTNKSK